MALILVMLVSALPAVNLAFAGPVPSSWATDYVNDANTAGLLTASASKDFRRELTREDFCELVVEMVERTLGKPLPIQQVNPFTDTSSVHVLKAYTYGRVEGVRPGIVNGVATDRFAPNSLIYALK